jgi:hypothetical protein
MTSRCAVMHDFETGDADECARCGLAWPSCIFDPRRPYRQPTLEEIERARWKRITHAERERAR